MIKLCDSIDTLSMAYLDDELAAEELRDLELHLIECAPCRTHVDGERHAIADLRRRLAPPPTPDLVRARLMSALDAEDAIIARQERDGRGNRFASWLLPGIASAVAVAALALFVFARPSDKARAPSIAEQVVRQQAHSPRISGPAGQMDVGGGGSRVTGDSRPRVQKVATWDAPDRVHGRTVVNQLYQVAIGEWGTAAVQVSILDARGLDLDVGRATHVNGYDLRVGVDPASGTSVVIHLALDGVGYVFTSADLQPKDLVELVAVDLIDRVDARINK